MKLVKIILVILVLLTVKNHYAQLNMCNGAAPFCTGTLYNYPAPFLGGVGQLGIDYGCLGSTPNPNWYYLQVATSGPIVIRISGAFFFDDIDFACWGPFTGPTTACTALLTNNCSPSCLSNTNPSAFYPSGNMIDCSFNA